MSRIILHMDMDAFYASVEQSDNPALKGKPVIVGGTSKRGVVSAASYEARRFGVHSAMPVFQAMKRCPQGVFLPVRMARYKEVSCSVMDILGGFSPLMEQVSIDEAYLDISGATKLFGTPKKIARDIKEGVRKVLSLSCSIGIAPNKFLAKIASDMNKPDGLTIISPEEVDRTIRDLPVRKVPGAGEKTVDALKKIGVRKLGDIRRISEEQLAGLTGKFSRRLVEFSRGIDPSPVIPYSEAKSISSETTLEKDTDDPEVIQKEILIQSEIVGKRLRDHGLRGGTVTLKLKRADFRLITRALTLQEPTNSTNSIYQQALDLLEHFDISSKFRLIGLGVSRLTPDREMPRQLNLFEKVDSKRSWQEIEKAMDAIRERFGRDAIKRGGLLKTKKDPQPPGGNCGPSGLKNN